MSRKQTIKIPEMIDTTIDTVQGVAVYMCTEMEDSNERWNDDYYTSDRYYVIHEGDKHHVYKAGAN